MYRLPASSLMVAMLAAVTLAWALMMFERGAPPTPVGGAKIVAVQEVGQDANAAEERVVADDHEVEDATLPLSVTPVSPMGLTHRVVFHGEPSRRDQLPSRELRPPIA